MPAPNPAALDFLLTRRSRPAKTLKAPGPDRAALQQLLTAASRSPDHGKLEPWRFVVYGAGQMQALADHVEAAGAALGKPPEDIAKGRQQFDMGVCTVAVIEVQKESAKIPAVEQTYAVGGVCLALLNAALAAGWGANWLSGWPSHDRGFMERLGLAPNERIAGFVHIGTETSAPPERPRPDVAAITEWHL
ncbi:MAG: nitroreductase [Pseudomonadota bacterium]